MTIKDNGGQPQQVHSRLASPRELQLLQNVWNGRHFYASEDQRRLGSWSRGQLEASLAVRQVA